MLCKFLYKFLANLAPPVCRFWKAFRIYYVGKAAGPAGRPAPKYTSIWGVETATPLAIRAPKKGGPHNTLTSNLSSVTVYQYFGGHFALL